MGAPTEEQRGKRGIVKLYCNRGDERFVAFEKYCNGSKDDVVVSIFLHYAENSKAAWEFAKSENDEAFAEFADFIFETNKELDKIISDCMSEKEKATNIEDSSMKAATISVNEALEASAKEIQKELIKIINPSKTENEKEIETIEALVKKAVDELIEKTSSDKLKKEKNTEIDILKELVPFGAYKNYLRYMQRYCTLFLDELSTPYTIRSASLIPETVKSVEPMCTPREKSTAEILAPERLIYTDSLVHINHIASIPKAEEPAMPVTPVNVRYIQSMAGNLGCGVLTSIDYSKPLDLIIESITKIKDSYDKDPTPFLSSEKIPDAILRDFKDLKSHRLPKSFEGKLADILFIADCIHLDMTGKYAKDEIDRYWSAVKDITRQEIEYKHYTKLKGLAEKYCLK